MIFDVTPPAAMQIIQDEPEALRIFWGMIGPYDLARNTHLFGAIESARKSKTISGGQAIQLIGETKQNYRHILSAHRSGNGAAPPEAVQAALLREIDEIAGRLLSWSRSS